MKTTTIVLPNAKNEQNTDNMGHKSSFKPYPSALPSYPGPSTSPKKRRVIPRSSRYLPHWIDIAIFLCLGTISLLILWSLALIIIVNKDDGFFIIEILNLVLGLGTLIVNVLILRSSMMQLNNQGNKPGDQANPTLIHPEGSALETGLVRTSSYAPAPSRQPEAGPSTPFNGSHQLSTGSSSHRPSSSSRRSSSLPRPSRTTEPKPLTGTPVFQPPQAGPSTTSSSHSRRKPSQIAKRAAPAPQPQQAGPSTASSSSHSRRKPNQTAKRATPASTTSNPSTSLATIPATAQAGPALGLPSGSGMVSSDHTSPPANVASNPSASFATPATVLTTATATAPATATGQGTNNPAQSEPGIALAPTSASASSGAATLQPVSDTPNHSETPAIAHSTSRGNQNLHPLASRIPGDIRHRYKSKSPNQSGPEA